MVDAVTHTKIVVSSEGTGGPYIMLPVEQLDAVERVLRQNHISYWVDAGAIAIDGKPAVTVINLGRGASASGIQRLLDAAN